MLLRNINTFVKVQVGSVLTPDDAEVETVLLYKVLVCGYLDLGGSASVVKLLEVGVLVIVGHALGAEGEIPRSAVNVKEQVLTHMAIRPKFSKFAPITVKHPETPFPDHRILFPPFPAGG